MADLENALFNILPLIDIKYKWLTQDKDKTFTLHTHKPTKHALHFKETQDLSFWCNYDNN